MTNTNNNMGSPYKALYINVGESFLQWLTCEATRRSHQLFVGKWCLRKEGRNSILMACHCSGQGSASDWLKHISLAARAISIKSTALIWDRSSLWNFCSCSSDAILRANRPRGGGGGIRGNYAYCLIQGVFGKTPSYLAVKMSFTVAREKIKKIYIWYVHF